MSVNSYKELCEHIGHEIHVVGYGLKSELEGDPVNVAVECWDCHIVILDFDKPRPIGDPHRFDRKEEKEEA